MNVDLEQSVSETQPSRVGTIVRWAVRLTSIPIMALVLTSLIPALLSYSVSARDDRILALALCGTCLGLVLGWRWAGIGGGIVLASVLVMLGQGDWSSPDPFSLAFGLQGILFLISWVLTSRTGSEGSAMVSLKWARRGAIVALMLGAVAGAFAILRGPGPVPLPKDKEPFIGTWDNGGGFSLEITPDGHARIAVANDSKLDSTNCPIAPGKTGVFQVYFRGDDRLELTAGFLGNSRNYHIDRFPYAQGKELRMMLNASDPYTRAAGIRLVKRQP